MRETIDEAYIHSLPAERWVTKAAIKIWRMGETSSETRHIAPTAAPPTVCLDAGPAEPGVVCRRLPEHTPQRQRLLLMTMMTCTRHRRYSLSFCDWKPNFYLNC